MHKAKILIVEDDAVIATRLEERLGLLGYEACGMAHSGEEAVDIAGRLRPEVILMDIVMPGRLDGIDAAEAIKSDLDIPVVFLTAYADDEYIRRAKMAEPYGYIVKPFHETEVKAAIEIALYKKDMEQRLQESEKKYRLLVESAQDLIFIIDSDIRIQYANHFAAGLLGYRPEELIGKYIEEVLHPDLSNGLKYSLQTVFESGEPLHAEGLLTFPDKELWLDTQLIPLEIESGEIKSILGISRDITKRREAEEERKRLLNELEAKNRELERFTYTVSHDLRSPLVTIQGFANMLQNDLENNDPEKAATDLKYIAKAGTKMDTLLSDTLQLSRIGHIANPPEDVPFGAIAQGALEQTAGDIHAHSIEVSVVEDFPTVHVDQMRIEELLVNLIGNSIKYRGDQPNPKIEIGYRLDGKETVFFVKDNGVGIEKSEQEKVFDLFYRIDTSSEGIGAGLAIVKRIVEVHGGRIWIESEKGKGTTVCFTLPVAGEVI